MESYINTENLLFDFEQLDIRNEAYWYYRGKRDAYLGLLEIDIGQEP